MLILPYFEGFELRILINYITISPYHFLFSRITECYHTRPSARSEDRSQHSQLAAGQQQRGDRLKYSESFPMEVLKLSWAEATLRTCVAARGAITTHPSLSFVTSVQQQTQTSCSAAVLQTAPLTTELLLTRVCDLVPSDHLTTATSNRVRR